MISLQKVARVKMENLKKTNLFLVFGAAFGSQCNQSGAQAERLCQQCLLHHGWEEFASPLSDKEKTARAPKKKKRKRKKSHKNTWVCLPATTPLLQRRRGLGRFMSRKLLLLHLCCKCSIKILQF